MSRDHPYGWVRDDEHMMDHDHGSGQGNPNTPSRNVNYYKSLMVEDTAMEQDGNQFEHVFRSEYHTPATWAHTPPSTKSEPEAKPQERPTRVEVYRGPRPMVTHMELSATQTSSAAASNSRKRSLSVDYGTPAEVSRMYRQRKKTEFSNLQQRVTDGERQLAAAQAEILSLRRELTATMDALRQVQREKQSLLARVSSGMTRESSVSDLENSPPTPPGSGRCRSRDPGVMSSPVHGMEVLHDRYTSQLGLFRKMQALADNSEATDEEMKEVADQFRADSVGRHCVPSDVLDDVVAPQHMLRNVFTNPSASDFHETPEQAAQEEHAWGLLAQSIGLTADQHRQFGALRERMRVALHAASLERIEMHNELHPFFMNKIGYGRTLHISQASADATEVARATTLLSRFKANLQLDGQIVNEFYSQLSELLSPRQMLQFMVYINRFVLSTVGALHAVLDLLIQNDNGVTAHLRTNRIGGLHPDFTGLHPYDSIVDDS